MDHKLISAKMKYIIMIDDFQHQVFWALDDILMQFLLLVLLIPTLVKKRDRREGGELR